MARDLGTSMDFCRQNGSNSKVQWIFVDEKPWNIWWTYVRHMFSFAIKYPVVCKKHPKKTHQTGRFLDPLGPSRLPCGEVFFHQRETLGMVLVGCEGKNIWKTIGFLEVLAASFWPNLVGKPAQFPKKSRSVSLRKLEMLPMCLCQNVGGQRATPLDWLVFLHVFSKIAYH